LEFYTMPDNKRRLLTIFLIVFVDLLGFGLILPLLPYYAETYGATQFVTGLLVASYAAAQFLGAPILGRLSDRYGRRPVLLISILGTSVGFLLLGLSEVLGQGIVNTLFSGNQAYFNVTVLTILFASRILDGLTGGNISVAQAYISDVTDESNRAQGLGLIGAAFGLGFIMGPVIGGSLYAISQPMPAYAAAALALVNFVAVFLFLPESLTPAQRTELADQKQPLIDLHGLANSFRRPRVGPLFTVRFFFGMAFSTFITIFSLYAAGKPLQLSAQQTGYVLGYVGVLAALVQGVVVGRLAKRFTDYRLILGMSMLMAVSLLAWAFIPNLIWLIIVLAPLSLAGGTLNTIINTALTKAVTPAEIGGALGISASLESITRFVAPVVGGYLLGAFGPMAPGFFTFFIMAGVVIFTWRRLIVSPDPPLQQPPATTEETELVTAH
jgi:DHA1 family tetracycline resistance protein-like MFS transporter